MLKRLRIIVLTGLLLSSVMPHLLFAADPTTPTSEGAATIPDQTDNSHSEVLLRLGNESNPVDGIFGPFTYGARGSHTFVNQMAFEAGYIRLHEPKTPAFTSVLDEAQFTFRLPEAHFISQQVVVGATAWKNRMIDMYTNVGGLELTRVDKITLQLGAYLGSATREEISGRFIGGQAAITSSLGPVEVGAAFMGGKIGDNGSYRKVAVEGSTELTHGKLPLALTLSVEERFFDFGDGRAASEPADEYIYIAGLEFHFEKVLFGNY